MRLIVFLVSIFFSMLGFAEQKMDKASEQALKETKQLLNDKNQREDVIKKNANAKKADKTLESIGAGDEEKQKIYELSSEIFEQIAKEANGDPEKMKAILQEAQKNPEAFVKRWSPEQQKKLKTITGDIEKKANTKSPKN